MIAFDTNVLVYAAQTYDDHRKARAIEVIAAAALINSILPVQALTEFTNSCRRKGLLDLASCAARVGEWSESFPTIAAAPTDVVRAIGALGRYRLSFYDALIYATVARAGVSVLISEDMQDGATYDGVLVVNPFDEANTSALAALLAA